MAYAAAGRAAEVVEEFQRIIDHREVDTVSPLYPLAYAQQARAYARLGKSHDARTDCEQFFEFLKDADPDVPILKEAKAEYTRLAR